MNRLFCFVHRLTRPAHKYLGLLAALYLLLMGTSGLLLANPAWIHSIEVPWSLTPRNYLPRNWNRMLVRQGLISEENSLYLAGKAGVLQSKDRGKTFSRLDQGFPESSYDRDTNSLLATETGEGRMLLAATRSGLYQLDANNPTWRRIHLPGLDKREPVIKVVRAGSRILALSGNRMYSAPADSLDFQPVPLYASGGEKKQPVPFFRVLHDLHNGTILGLPGKLLTDLLALLLIFLAGSGLLIWYLPRHLRRFTIGRARLAGIFRFNWRQHKKIGLYGVLFLIISGTSGALLRPPLLIAIAPYSLAAGNPILAFSPRARGLGGIIQNAAYASADNTILLATETGFWQGPADGSAPFRPLAVPVPVHGMGVTVFEEIEENVFLLGSFSGLYIWSAEEERVWRLPRPGLQNANPYMSNDLVTGVIMEGSTPRFRIDYHDGLLPMNREMGQPPAMPPWLAAQNPLSLWHYLFELHNGRLFERWLGPAYLFLVPAGGLLLVLLCLSGLYDWWYPRRKKQR